MFVRELLKNTSECTPLRVVRNNDTSIFLLQSYACGYHSYVKVWNFTINDSQQCKIKKNKELDPSAVTLIYDDSHLLSFKTTRSRLRHRRLCSKPINRIKEN